MRAWDYVFPNKLHNENTSRQYLLKEDGKIKRKPYGTNKYSNTNSKRIELLKLVSAIFYQIFMSHQMIAFQEL